MHVFYHYGQYRPGNLSNRTLSRVFRRTPATKARGKDPVKLALSTIFSDLLSAAESIPWTLASDLWFSPVEKFSRGQLRLVLKIDWDVRRPAGHMTPRRKL